MKILNNLLDIFFGGNSFLGIDIGTFSIKFAEISKEKNNRLYLLGLDEIIIPKNIKTENIDYEKSILLLKLINSANIRNKRAIFSINNSLTNYIIITLPNIEDKKILKYVELNLSNFLPAKFEDIHMKWEVLERNKNNMKILLIIINKDIIIKYKKIAKTAKLNFYSYETEANSLFNSLIKKTDEKMIILVLDVRMKNSSLSLIQGAQLLKSSSFSISVNYLDEHYKKKEATELNGEEKNDNIIKNKEKVKKLVLEKKEELKKIQKECNIFIKKIKKNDDNIILAKANGTSEASEIILKIFTFFIKKFEIKKDKIVKINNNNNNNNINEIKIINKDRDFLLKTKIELIKKLEAIEKKEEKFEKEFEKELIKIEKNNQVFFEDEYQREKILLIKKNKNIDRRRVEQKRWYLEDKLEELEKKEEEFNKENQQKLKSLKKNQNIIELKIREIEKQQNQIQNFIERLKEKSRIEEIKEVEVEEAEGVKYGKSDPQKLLDSYFELFYEKIWLFVMGFDYNKKQKFKKVIISGGADFIPQLTKYIQKKINQKFFDTSVEVANPFVNIDNIELKSKLKKNPQFSIAIGSALKGFKKN